MGSRYFFQIVERTDTIDDSEGMDLPDLASALKEADTGARDLLAAAIVERREEVPNAVIVRDDSGHALATVKLKDLIAQLLADEPSRALGGTAGRMSSKSRLSPKGRRRPILPGRFSD